MPHWYVNRRYSEKDKLLEYTSCNSTVSSSIIEEITKFDQRVNFDGYLETIFDAFNIDYYEHSQNIKVIEAAEQLPNEIFSKLKADRLTITSDRSTALVREDVEYLNFEHPVIEDVMDYISTGEYGNVNISGVSLRNVKTGSLFLESYYTIECLSPNFLQLQRFLPLTPLRFVFDERHREIGNTLTHDKLNKHCKSLNDKVIRSAVPLLRPKIEAMLYDQEKITRERIVDAKNKAIKAQREYLLKEIQRLKDLQILNSTVRPDEISFFEQQIDAGKRYIERAAYKLQAIRVIVNIQAGL